MLSREHFFCSNRKKNVSQNRKCDQVKITIGNVYTEQKQAQTMRNLTKIFRWISMKITEKTEQHVNSDDSIDKNINKSGFSLVIII